MKEILTFVLYKSSGTTVLEVENTDSDSGTSVDVQDTQHLVEVKTPGTPHNSEHLNRAQDNSGK
jgi:hypothetical protein